MTKTQKGQYADYSTSNWARKERSLNEEERSAIEAHGLSDLNDFMPKRPTQDEVNVIMEMFEASVDGELYDPMRWGNFFKPYGLDVPEGAEPNNSSGSSAPKAASAPRPAPVAAAPAPVAAPVDDIPFKSNEEVAAEAAPAATADSGAGKDASDILAMIRSRKSD